MDKVRTIFADYDRGWWVVLKTGQRLFFATGSRIEHFLHALDN